MEKPIQIVIEDLRETIAKDINDTKLPACFVTPILKDIYEQCIALEKQQYEQAKRTYEDSLKNDTTNKKAE